MERKRQRGVGNFPWASLAIRRKRDGLFETTLRQGTLPVWESHGYFRRECPRREAHGNTGVSIQLEGRRSPKPLMCRFESCYPCQHHVAEARALLRKKPSGTRPPLTSRGVALT